VRLIVRLFVLLVLVGLAAGAFDYLAFVGRADARLSKTASTDGAQAVVSLTGASDARIVEGVELAESLKLPLLISGVHVDTRPTDIARITNRPEIEIACCVALGRAAATTEGNGAEVAEWARRHQLQRIVVVTSEYHMDRALTELQRYMPEADFIPHAVATTRVPPRDWWRDQPTARRLVEEWAKFRIASFRASQTVPTPPPPASPEPAQPEAGGARGDA
jgi:uncharacterized SAM-binding protein YcdF (DUF218 family)